MRLGVIVVSAAIAGAFCPRPSVLALPLPSKALQIGALQIRDAQMKDPPLPIPGGSQPSRGNPKDAVQFLAPGQITVAAGRSALVDLHFRVAGGLHINSHTPHEKTLIATRLAVIEQKGFNVTGVDFPAGTDYALAFAPKEKLSVYTGDFTLHAHLTAQAGEHLLQGALHYQACDVNSCMPPETLPVEVSILAR